MHDRTSLSSSAAVAAAIAARKSQKVSTISVPVPIGHAKRHFSCGKKANIVAAVDKPEQKKDADGSIPICGGSPVVVVERKLENAVSTHSVLLQKRDVHTSVTTSSNTPALEMSFFVSPSSNEHPSKQDASIYPLKAVESRHNVEQQEESAPVVDAGDAFEEAFDNARKEVEEQDLFEEAREKEQAEESTDDQSGSHAQEEAEEEEQQQQQQDLAAAISSSAVEGEKGLGETDTAPSHYLDVNVHYLDVEVDDEDIKMSSGSSLSKGVNDEEEEKHSFISPTRTVYPLSESFTAYSSASSVTSSLPSTPTSSTIEEEKKVMTGGKEDEKSSFQPKRSHPNKGDHEIRSVLPSCKVSPSSLLPPPPRLSSASSSSSKKSQSASIWGRPRSPSSKEGSGTNGSYLWKRPLLRFSSSPKHGSSKSPSRPNSSSPPTIAANYSSVEEEKKEGASRKTTAAWLRERLHLSSPAKSQQQQHSPSKATKTRLAKSFSYQDRKQERNNVLQRRSASSRNLTVDLDLLDEEEEVKGQSSQHQQQEENQQGGGKGVALYKAGDIGGLTCRSPSVSTSGGSRRRLITPITSSEAQTSFFESSSAAAMEAMSVEKMDSIGHLEDYRSPIRATKPSPLRAAAKHSCANSMIQDAFFEDFWSVSRKGSSSCGSSEMEKVFTVSPSVCFVYRNRRRYIVPC